MTGIVFAKRITKLRQDRGWSQAELGERVGLSWNQVSRYERGVSTPSVDMVHRFADALEVEDAHLLERAS